jgi:hypothetical protein
MLRRVLPVVFLFAAALSVTAAALQSQQPPVVVHEWGTFTTVAGEDGQAVRWLPLGGPTDLPCFVDVYKNRAYKVLTTTSEAPVPITYEAARSSLIATVRMETPVLYFYAEKPAAVSVRVKFPRGLITEWFPYATVTQPNVYPDVLDDPRVVSIIDWPYVEIAPGRQVSLPKGNGESHYYAARATDSAPVRVNGNDEKFLFYRGVASFPVPISAALTENGVRLTNLGTDPVPGVILFENRGGRLSFTDVGTLTTPTTITRPTVVADAKTLRAKLIEYLKSTGLYQREAEAMVETWRDSWFEEGTRVFYLVPSASVDRILPLAVTPAPTSVARAFVGRMEIITPESLAMAQTALAANDVATLEKRGRFLGPIADRLAAKMESVSDRNRVRATLNTVFANYVTRFASCQ